MFCFGKHKDFYHSIKTGVDRAACKVACTLKSVSANVLTGHPVDQLYLPGVDTRESRIEARITRRLSCGAPDDFAREPKIGFTRE